jgi:hypothetical protein
VSNSYSDSDKYVTYICAYGWFVTVLSTGWPFHPKSWPSSLLKLPRAFHTVCVRYSKRANPVTAVLKESHRRYLIPGWNAVKTAVNTKTCRTENWELVEFRTGRTFNVLMVKFEAKFPRLFAWASRCDCGGGRRGNSPRILNLGCNWNFGFSWQEVCMHFIKT